MHKTGLGYDIHSLVKGRKLVLGGVDIPYEKGLDGHSDADVLIHALCDALLGALGMGDIGEHFSDTDEQYKDIASLKLLHRVKEIVDADNFAIENIDCNIHAQEPNLKEYKAGIRKCISSALDIEEKRVNIKAKTNEFMGPVGRKEAIAATVIVLLTNNK